MSKVKTRYTELACIDAAFSEYGCSNVVCRNKEQESLYKFWRDYRSDMGMLRDILHGYFGTTDEINKIIAGYGLDLHVPGASELAPPTGAGLRAAAGILDYAADWDYSEKETVIVGGASYKAVKLRGLLGYYKLLGGRIVTILKIRLTSADSLYLTTDIEPCPYDKTVLQFMIGAVPISTFPCYIVVPETTLHVYGDIGWLVGMQVDSSREIVVDWAGQESLISINVKGIVAKSVTAARFFSGCIEMIDYENIIYVVDKPYNIWIQREGIHDTVISASVTMEDWVNEECSTEGYSL
jgi:hypothetical protein